jgi:hypothetical protein
LNTCIISSFASALDYISNKPGHKFVGDAAEKLAKLAPSLEGKNVNECLRKISTVMEEHVPSIAWFSKANVHRRRRKMIRIGKEDIVTLLTPYPTLVIPIGHDGSVSHAITIVDDLIFDSTQKYALKLGEQSLDWTCGDCGCRDLGLVVRFNTPMKKAFAKHFSDQVVLNWDCES